MEQIHKSMVLSPGDPVKIVMKPADKGTQYFYLIRVLGIRRFKTFMAVEGILVYTNLPSEFNEIYDAGSKQTFRVHYRSKSPSYKLDERELLIEMV